MDLQRAKNYFLNIPAPSFLHKIDYDKTILRSKTVVQVLYYFLVYFAVRTMMFLRGFRGAENFSPAWPIGWWAQYLDYNSVIIAIQLFFLLGVLLGALFYKKVWARVLVFISYFQLFGFFNSFEQVDHAYYHWFYALFFLMFLPDIWEKKSKDRGMSFLTFLWGAQAFVLLSYSMAGLEKIIRAIKELVIGKVSLFSPESISLLVTFWTAQRGELFLFSEWVINHPTLSWILMWVSVYIQLFSIVVAFRPRLHRVWGVLLVLFHVGTYFSIGITFSPTIALFVFLFWMSPFTPDTLRLKEVLRDLPIFGDVWRMMRGRVTNN